jgi:hypothetical protein
MTVMRIKHDASNKSGKVPKDGVESRECVFAPVECPMYRFEGNTDLRLSELRRYAGHSAGWL